jgi:transcription elongation factor GreA
MKNAFTKEGLDFYRKKIAAQQAKTSNTGKEAGKEAGDNCDWHDNFGYEDAKRRLEIESRRLQELVGDVAECQIIDIEEQDARVAIGTTIKIYFDNTDTEKEYTIGAFGESDSSMNLISYKSPLAQGIMNMKKGETKEIRIGTSDVEIEIIDIKPPTYRYRKLITELFASKDTV